MPNTYNMYQLKSKKAVDFYQRHPHLDFDTMNTLFVDILEGLMENLSDKIDNSHNTELLKQVASRLLNLEENYSKQNSSMREMEQKIATLSIQIQKEINSVLHDHKELLKNDIRETIRSNQGDVGQMVETILSRNSENFSQKIELLFQNKDLQQSLMSEFAKVNDKIGSETTRLFDTLHAKNTSSEGILQGFTEIMNSKYSEFDTQMKTRIDTFLSTNHSQNSSMFSELVDKISKSGHAVDMVHEYLNGQSNSNKKGKQGEAKLEPLLSKVFPDAEITNTSGKTSSGDFIIERKSRNKILIDTKDYNTVVPIKEVAKLIRDVEKHGCHGMLLSQNSGIAQKEHFEINIHDKHILIFLHDVGYDDAIIRLAANAIEQLEPLVIAQAQQTGQSIPDDLLKEINQEYQQLVRQKTNLIETVKKNHNELLQQLHDFDLSKLDSFLNTRFSNPGKISFRCVCGFIGKNAKSLALHRRKCKHNNQVISVDTEST
jgi:hypothetical protein